MQTETNTDLFGRIGISVEVTAYLNSQGWVNFSGSIAYPGERMLRFGRTGLLLAAAVMMAGQAVAQPALTTIQDILYRADGSRFNGTMFVRWNSFLAGDTSNVATANLTLPIVNGVLNVRLVPTTTATAGAQYTITYNSSGQNQFTEIWAVRPSAVRLRVRDVRLSTGTVVGPPAVTTPMLIGDVVGLSDALASRPLQGAGFGLGRTAVINSSGQIDAAAGRLGDCVRVDGSAGACGASGGIVPLFSDAEPMSGAINGVNTAFTLLHAPSPIDSLSVFRNGLLMKHGYDYAIAGATVTFFAGAVPQAGDQLLASYRYANPNDPLATLTAAQVVCSSAGSSTSATALTQLGTCSIPSALLNTGDRIEVQFHYGHTGTATAFTGEVRWGAATALTRTSVAAETALTGRLTFAILAAGQSFDVQSWGNSFALANAVGLMTADTTQNLTISLDGQMAAATADSVTLRNFTVIRYPAQSNP